MSINKIQPSATVLMNSLAEAKKASGVRVFNLSAGEPKVKTNQIILDSAIKFINQGEIFYPLTEGLPQLRKLATNWINNNYACNYQDDECIVVNGGKFGLYLLLQHLLTSGELGVSNPEVLIPAPYWVSYPTIVRMFGGKPSILNTSEATNWKITPADLIATITKNTKILILNNGVNPTGVVYAPTELSAILELANKHGLLVISDEVYSGLVYDDKPYVSCGSYAQYRNNVIVIQSCSKNFAMTGWRIGFVFAPTRFIKAISILISQTTSGVSPISQYAAIAALENAKLITANIKSEMQRRRDVLLTALDREFNIEFNIKLAPPHSALYMFVALDKLGVKSGISSEDFCYRALDEANVAIVPGSAFGVDGFVPVYADLIRPEFLLV